MPQQIRTIEEWVSFFRSPGVKVFLKHSAGCGRSAEVFCALDRAERRSLFHFSFVEFQASPDLWHHLKCQVFPDIVHQSPQVLVLEDQTVRASAHHERATVDWVLHRLTELGALTAGGA